MNRLRSFVAVVVLAGASSCGWTVDSAREAGAQKTCDYMVRCSQVGSGKAYATRDECLTAQRTNFQNLWPTSTCASTLNPTNLDTCLKAIDASACGSVLDLLSTLTKCTAGTVCSGP